MPATAATEFRSLSQIADEENAKPHQIDYLIAKLGIKPVLMMGNCRVFGAADVAAVRRELHEIGRRQDARRSVGQPAVVQAAE